MLRLSWRCATHNQKSSTLNTIITYRYDQIGQLSHAQRCTGEQRIIDDDLQFGYSQRGEIVRETGHMGQLQHEYDEMGNRISTTLPDGRVINYLYYGSGHLPQNLRFQGQYLEREIGLHYNTFRFYDPDIGRFVSPDPIGLMGGVNIYSYAPNPISWIDPLGWNCGANWTKKGWKHVYERHYLKTKPRWAHKSKFEIGNEQNLKKIIDKTIKSGKTTSQKNGRTKYELDHGSQVGSKTNQQTGVAMPQTKVTVVLDKHGSLVTAFPSD